MEAAVDRLFTDDIRAAAAAAFGASELELLGDFESYVYACTIDGAPRILRVTHEAHRSAAQIEAEMAWVEHQATNGVRFARPVRATDERFTHTVPEGGGVFHACAFERAPGALPTADDWTPELFEAWGRLLGRSHHVTQSYGTPPGVAPRLSWAEDPYMVNGRSWIPESERDVRAAWDKVWGAIADLPRDTESFGLCHTDLHQGNFHVHDGDIVAFDTDDCTYHWFLEDISSVFFYGARFAASGDDEAAFIAWAWPAFWRGYSAEHELPPEWIGRIDLFQRGRALVLFALMHLKFEPGDEIRETHAPRYRDLILRERPLLDATFEV